MKQFIKTIGLLAGIALSGTMYQGLAQLADLSLISTSSDAARININPAYIPSDGMDFIHLADVSLMGNLSAPLNKLMPLNEQGKRQIVIEDALTHLSTRPSIFDGRLNLLSSGFKTDVGFFSFQLSGRSQLSMSTDPALAQFISEGNATHLGEKIETGSIKMDVRGFMEYALGYSNYIAFDDYGDMKLTLGGRIKYLSGVLAAQSRNGYFSFLSTKNGEKITIESDQAIDFTGPIEYDTHPDGTVDFDSFRFFKSVDMSNLFANNTGWGCDLGVEFQIMPELRISGAVTDIGMIRWNHEIRRFRESLMGDNALVYEGEDITDLINGKEGEKRTSSIEEISQRIQEGFYNEEGENFTTSLPTRFHIAAEYQIASEFLIAGAVGGYKSTGEIYPWGTIVGTMQPSNAFGCSVSISTMKGCPIALGMGMVMGKHLQLTLAADNLLAIGYNQSTFANLRVGIATRF